MNVNLSALEKWTEALLPELLDEHLFRKVGFTITPSAPSTSESFWSKVGACNRCDLHLGRAKAVKARGSISSPLLVVGDFPNEVDEETGLAFSGDEGDLLAKMLTAIKLDPHSTYCTTAWKCRPTLQQRQGTPLPSDCLSHLSEELMPARSGLVLAFGAKAGQLLSGTELPLEKLRGQWHLWNHKNVLCTHHPRDLLRFPERKREAWADLQTIASRLEKHL
jgi:uracil-DNA glycosylase